jgi:hypothetical protein
MMVLNDKDEKILFDYLNSYKEAFEAMNNLLIEIAGRVELTSEEVELSKICESKYKNMMYHIRKWNPKFQKP